MSIRKFGTEPAKAEVRPEDNDPETLDVVKKQAQNQPRRGDDSRDRDSDDGQTYSL